MVPEEPAAFLEELAVYNPHLHAILLGQVVDPNFLYARLFRTRPQREVIATEQTVDQDE